ncbi:MAG TPA: 5-oxoprolinase subunit PxpA [Longilinea sp.]|nr:5-oxoprolinase subunit PxpA [Longilinea sp.]
MIDINSDIGEAFGAYPLGDDEAIMAYIDSANIACGMHAGDPIVMECTVRLAKEHNLRIGAHPGWPDLQGFGRREMALSPDETEAYVLYQIGALAGFCRANGVELIHVKPHGALYNQAARNPALAAAVARAVNRFSRQVILVGLAGSCLVQAGLDLGLSVWSEAFPDRAYEEDGSLRSRKLPGALVEDPAEAAVNGVNLAKEGICAVVEGQVVTWKVDTLCVHGDSPHAVETARLLREALIGV